MRFNSNKIGNFLIAAVAILSSVSLTSCEDEPDKFELSGGTPTVYYIRPSDVNAKDSLLVQAYPSASICLVGDNMKSVEQMYFNDQKAILNTSYITDHTLIVEVPSNIPDVVTNKIYMINKDKDTTTYDFHVIVPAPVVSSMSCEYAPTGSEVTISGSYFIDDPNTPISLTLPDGKVIKDFTNKSRTALTFTMPECDTEGPITVTSIYGSTKSAFYYKDTRGLLFDFDGVTGLGNHGWHERTITSDGTSLTGKFVQLGNGSAKMTAAGDWDDSNFSFEYWPGSWNTPTDYPDDGKLLTSLADFSDYQNMAIKFEMYVPADHPWSAGGMQIIMAGLDKISYGNAGTDINGNLVAGSNNSYLQSNALPRAIYRPWEAAGSYDTGGKWVTVTIPIADFKYGFDGTTSTGNLSAKDFSSLVIFVVGGGVEGTDCTPIIKIDNIRAVPYK